MTLTEPSAGLESVRGGCHCGAVRFEAQLDLSTGFRCNCSICTKLGAFVATAAPATFACTCGADDLTEYRFGAQNLCRFSCRRCGVFCFARSTATRGGHEDVNVNLNTLDAVELATLPVVYFDGRHDNFDPRPAPSPMFPPALASAR